jgi:isoquinoline 1-oxidoreductase beta subunit
VWAATLAPDLARVVAARAASLRAGDVTLYPMPAGEPGGRALPPDAVALAVDMARELRRPVQLSLSPRAGQNHASVEPPLLARMTALPGPGGITAALRMRLASSSGISASLGRLAGGEASAGASLGEFTLPYGIADLAIDGAPLQLPFRTGYMRGAPERALAFAAESFVDELARAAGLEPLAFRMAMLGSSPRLARCLQTAAGAAGWDGGGRGSTMGLAAVSAYGSHIGLIANATIAPDQSIQVHRLVAAVDCGRVINPQLVRQQIEGGLIWALGQATVRTPEWAAGMPRSRGQGALDLPRIGDTPDIAVQIISSNAAPGGVSALGVPPLAPAIANAIYAATGKRLRNLPFDPTSA